jgi:hypothetical protein
MSAGFLNDNLKKILETDCGKLPNAPDEDMLNPGCSKAEPCAGLTAATRVISCIYGTSIMGACQNAAFWPSGSKTIQSQQYIVLIGIVKNSVLVIYSRIIIEIRQRK